ncbi:MAG TPA: hypothetical protein VHQ24_00240 [Lachnospiraceae bacterium]|nr:hypothetical protein [Lachnospiraceae bacterium]
MKHINTGIHLKHKERVGSLVALCLCLILLVGCGSSKKSKAETLVLSVDDSKVYLNEMMYHVMLSEFRGELYASYLGSDNYWDMEYAPGVTMREELKEIAMNDAIKYEILYTMAKNEGYELTSEEEKDCQDKVDSILKNVPKDQLSEDGLTEDILMGIQRKIAICTRYYNDYVTTLGVASDATVEEKAKAFDTAFESLKEQHVISIESSIWDKVKIGEKKVS